MCVSLNFMQRYVVMAALVNDNAGASALYYYQPC